jgi:hypothetical protein
MTDTDANIWEQARVQLVKHRQYLIEVLAKSYDRGTVDELLKVQAAIDVLDTAGDEDVDEDDE